MKKALTILVLLAMSMMLFASGAKEGEPNIIVSEDYVGNENAKTVITVALCRDETILSQYPDRKAYNEKALRAWAEANPDYAAEFQFVDSTQISIEMSKYLSQAQMGVGPDVLHLDSYYVGSFLDAGLLQPIESYIPQEELDQWFPWTKEVTCRDGHQYALWGETDARVLYYRTDLISEPPRTWEDVIELGSQLHEQYGIEGFLSPSGQSEGASNEGTWPYFWGQGGVIFGEDSRPVLGEGENREKMISIYQWWRDLIDSGASPQEIASMVSGNNILPYIAADDVAMFMGGTWVWSQIQTVAPDPSKWDFTFLPMREADQYSNTCGGWTWAVLAEDPEKQAASVSFLMAFMGGKEAMYERCIASGNLPVRQDVWDMEYFAEDPIYSRFREQFAIGKTRPASSLYPAVSDINSKMLGKVLVNELTPEEAVDQLQSQTLVEWEAWKKTQN